MNAKSKLNAWATLHGLEIESHYSDHDGKYYEYCAVDPAETAYSANTSVYGYVTRNGETRLRLGEGWMLMLVDWDPNDPTLKPNVQSQKDSELARGKTDPTFAKWASMYELTIVPRGDLDELMAGEVEDIQMDIDGEISHVALDTQEQPYPRLFGVATKWGDVFLILDPEDFEDLVKPPPGWDPGDEAYEPNLTDDFGSFDTYTR